VRHRLTPTIRIALLLTAALLLLTGCEGDGIERAGETAPHPDQEIDHFTLTQTREADRLWVLRAVHARIYEKADRVETSNVRIDFYGDNDEVQSTLTADYGTLLRRTNDIEAIGNVVVTAEDGTILKTEKLAWNERLGKISTEEEVEITKGDDVMTGVGMESDPDLTNIKVKRDFKAYVKTPEGELIEEH